MFVIGHGTNIIQGLAVSLKSTALFGHRQACGILTTFQLTNLLGTTITITTMLGIIGIIVTLDAFSPVKNNAGGIVEMSDLPKEVRHSTDALNAVDTTTNAVTNGYAIDWAGLGVLVLFAAYSYGLQYFEANIAQYSYFAEISTVSSICMALMSLLVSFSAA